MLPKSIVTSVGPSTSIVATWPWEPDQVYTAGAGACEPAKGNGRDAHVAEGTLSDEHPQGQFFLTIVAAFSELEVEMCRSRVRDGLGAAKRRGKRLGRPRKDMDTAIKMWQSRDYSISEICETVGCVRQTLYNEIHRRCLVRE